MFGGAGHAHRDDASAAGGPVDDERVAISLVRDDALAEVTR